MITNERLAEIERHHGSLHISQYGIPVNDPGCLTCELLAALREARAERKQLIADGTLDAYDLRTERDTLQRRVEALEKADQENYVGETSVQRCCRLIFEEDWDYFSERPTLMDAVQRHVEAALRGGGTG